MALAEQALELLQTSQKVGATGYQMGRSSVVMQVSLLLSQAIRDRLSLQQFAQRFVAEVAEPKTSHGADV